MNARQIAKQQIENAQISAVLTVVRDNANITLTELQNHENLVNMGAARVKGLLTRIMRNGDISRSTNEKGEATYALCRPPAKKKAATTKKNTTKKAVATTKKAATTKKNTTKKAATTTKKATTTTAKETVEKKVIAEPKSAEQLKATKKTSKQYKLVSSLFKGATIAQMEKLTGWNTKTVRAALHCDVKTKGYGIEKVGEKYFLILPAAVSQPLYA